MILFLRKSELFFSVYPRTIVFGKCCNRKVDETKAFTFDLTLLLKLYEALIHILNTLKDPNLVTKEEEICSYNSHNYRWLILNESVILVNECSQIEILKIELDYYQLNEVIFALSEVILPSLQLNDYELEFFDHLLNSEVTNLIELTQKERFLDIVKHTKFEAQFFKLFKLFKFYLDIIFIVSKLKMICNQKFLPTYLEPLLTIV